MGDHFRGFRRINRGFPDSLHPNFTSRIRRYWHYKIQHQPQRSHQAGVISQHCHCLVKIKGVCLWTVIFEIRVSVMVAIIEFVDLVKVFLGRQTKRENLGIFEHALDLFSSSIPALLIKINDHSPQACTDYRIKRRGNARSRLRPILINILHVIERFSQGDGAQFVIFQVSELMIQHVDTWCKNPIPEWFIQVEFRLEFDGIGNTTDVSNKPDLFYRGWPVGKIRIITERRLSVRIST